MDTRADRAAGAVAGAFVGDALSLGPHWYYDLEALRREFGPWIDDYTRPRPGRYHAGLAAGDSSQVGYLLALTARSLIDCDGYDPIDFCRRLDEELFPRLDGTPTGGPGGYTSQSIREAWRKRVVERCDWSRCAGPADTTEAIERCIAIAVRYSGDPGALARHVAANTRLTQNDDAIVAMTVAYCAVLGRLVQGERLDGGMSRRLMASCKQGELPFYAVTSGVDLGMPEPGEADAPGSGRFTSPDALLTPSSMAIAAEDPGIRIEPAWKVSLVYGMPCAIYHQLPAAYYLAARFRDDFEAGVLHAVNGGGQNQARAVLTGALIGAQVGLEGIPRRFIDGLTDGDTLVDLARRLAAHA